MHLESPRPSFRRHHLSDCIFCDIARGAAASENVYEDNLTLVFMDLFPASRGHTLVIPKAHSANVFEIDENSMRAAAETTRRIAHAIRSALQPEGIVIVQLNGEAAGQTVFHHHTHLIPRNSGDPQGIHGRKQGDPEDLALVAASIRSALP